MSLNDIFNFIQVGETVATGGQPSADQLREASEAGYEVVVNLAPDGLETSLPEEKSLLESLGIEYHQIPVPWTAPHLDQLDEFERVMVAIGRRRTLIHCQANFRVTVFFAMYATAKLGWSDDDADALIDRIWSGHSDYEMEDSWRNFIAAARARVHHEAGA